MQTLNNTIREVTHTALLPNVPNRQNAPPLDSFVGNAREDATTATALSPNLQVHPFLTPMTSGVAEAAFEQQWSALTQSIGSDAYAVSMCGVGISAWMLSLWLFNQSRCEVARAWGVSSSLSSTMSVDASLLQTAVAGMVHVLPSFVRSNFQTIDLPRAMDSLVKTYGPMVAGTLLSNVVLASLQLLEHHPVGMISAAGVGATVGLSMALPALGMQLPEPLEATSDYLLGNLAGAFMQLLVEGMFSQSGAAAVGLSVGLLMATGLQGKNFKASWQQLVDRHGQNLAAGAAFGLASAATTGVFTLLHIGPWVIPAVLVGASLLHVAARSWPHQQQIPLLHPVSTIPLSVKPAHRTEMAYPVNLGPNYLRIKYY